MLITRESFTIQTVGVARQDEAGHCVVLSERYNTRAYYHPDAERPGKYQFNLWVLHSGDCPILRKRILRDQQPRSHLHGRPAKETSQSAL